MDAWMQKDVEELRRLIARGDTSDEIAERLGWSKGDVWMKARKLGLDWRLAEVEHRKAGQVRFIAQYDDGSKGYFIIEFGPFSAVTMSQPTLRVNDKRTVA